MQLLELLGVSTYSLMLCIDCLKLLGCACIQPQSREDKQDNKHVSATSISVQG